MNTRRGFTLLELLAALAVITIIGTVAVPRVSTTVENNKRIACILNREEIIRDYRLQLIFRPDLTIEEYLDNTEQYFEKKVTCPAHGEYSVDEHKIMCTKHGAVYYKIKIENSIYFPFFAEDFDETLIEELIAHRLDDWDFEELEGEKYFTNKTTGENRFYLENDLESYRIKSNVVLDGNNGYGIMVDTYTENNGTDTGYIFQFDPGFRNGEFIFRKRSGGSESYPFIRIKPQDVYENPIDSSYWNDPHQVMVEVIKISETQKSMKVYIDDVEITKDNVVVIDIIDMDDKFFGFRTWGSSRAFISDIRVEEIQ